MKNCKKIISILLVAISLFCMFNMFTFAADQLNYVVLGDSIGWGFGVLNHDEACFGRIVANTNGYNYSNYAVNGHRTEQLLARLSVNNVADDVSKADIISVSIGGNDFLTSNMPALIAQAQSGDYSGFDNIIETSKVNFAAIIAKLKELNPNAVILMQTLYNPRTDDLRDIYQYAVNLLNSMIRGYLEENPGAYEIIEVGNAFNGIEADVIAVDQIHPNAKGNVIIAREVLKKLYDLGLGNETEPLILVEGIDQIPQPIPKLIGAIMNIINAIMDLINFISGIFSI